MQLDQNTTQQQDYFFPIQHKPDTLLYFRGAVTDYQLFRMANFLNSHFKDNPADGRRFFSIFIELAQNIAYHSAEREFMQGHSSRGIGSLYVEDQGEAVMVSTGNFVTFEQANKVKRRCDEINDLADERLKDLRRSIKQSSVVENEKSGNFGLIQVALKSKNKVEYALEQVRSHENLQYMTLRTVLEKKN